VACTSPANSRTRCGPSAQQLCVKACWKLGPKAAKPGHQLRSARTPCECRSLRVVGALGVRAEFGASVANSGERELSAEGALGSGKEMGLALRFWKWVLVSEDNTAVLPRATSGATGGVKKSECSASGGLIRPNGGHLLGMAQADPTKRGELSRLQLASANAKIVLPLGVGDVSNGQPASSSRRANRLPALTCGVRRLVSRSEDQEGASPMLESEEILRVLMTTSWLQRLARGISSHKAFGCYSPATM